MQQHHDAGAATAAPSTITGAIEMLCEQLDHTVSQDRSSPTPGPRARRRPAARLVISPRAQTFASVSSPPRVLMTGMTGVGSYGIVSKISTRSLTSYACLTMNVPPLHVIRG